MKLFTSAYIAIILFIFPILSYGQAPDLGTAVNFAVFTAVGAFSNDGNTVVTGDIGTNVGTFTGFPPGVVIGNIHVANTVSAVAATDVADAYAELAGLTCGQVIGTTLGNNQILTPDIYCLGAASTLNGNLILDAEGDPDAIFIFQIDGALSTTTLSSITLINGASLCNVYWQINGAVELGVNSLFLGTILANGAISLLEGATLLGRALSQAGAVDMHNNVVTVGLPPVASVIIADGPISFCAGDSVILSGNIEGVWSNGSLAASITVTEAGDYYVVNTTICGSDTSNHIIISINPLPVCTVTGDVNICEGESTQLCASADAIEFLWNTGATTICISVIVEGIYSVTITDSNGCTSDCNISVNVNPVPECSITGDTSICEGESTILCVPLGASEYVWNTGATTNCITVTTAGTYSVTITDANGCSSTCSQTVIVNPGPDCTITGNNFICEGGSTLICAPTGAASYLWNTGAISNCITVTVQGLYTVTVTDIDGCSSVCSETVTVNLQPGCSITGDTSICEGETTILCVPAGAQSYLWNTGDITNCITADAAGLYSVTITYIGGCVSTCSTNLNINDLPECTITGETEICDGASTDLCAPPEAGSYIWSTGAIQNCITVTEAGIYSVTVTDINGCTSVCTVEVTINPIPLCTITGQTIICEGESTILCAPLGAVDYLWNTGDITNCITVSAAGQYTVTVTDINGCTSICTETVTISPGGAISITCPADILIECDELTVPSNTGVAVAIGSCGASASALYTDITIAGLCPQESTIIRTWVATDSNGNSVTCNQTITIQDSTVPVIECPDNLTVECADDVPQPDISTINSSDNCGGVTLVEFVGDVLSNQVCDNQFIITRTYRVTDDCGNSAECSQLITVFDNTLPTIICPVNITVECAGDVPQPDISTIISSDNCGGVALVEFVGDVISNQLCDNQFTITRTFRVTDDCGNSDECNQIITVFDDTFPTIICPVNITVECAGDVPQPDISTIISSDNCGGVALVEFVGDVISNQLCDNQFTITRTYRVTDDCGNSSEWSQLVTVFDNTLPTIICPVNITVECADEVPQPDVSTIISSDNCDGVVLVEFVGDVISNQLCDNQFTVTRTYRVTDDCGNSAECSQLITVFDNTLPTIICPVNITVECAGDVPQPDISTIISSDNCGGVALVEFVGDVISNQLCDNQFTITRTYRVTDDCGNSAECSQLVTVFDNTLPTIICPVNITVECAGDVPAPDISTIISSDNCGEVALVEFVEDVISNQLCDNQFTITRTYRVTDDCGNSAECSQLVTVFDNTLPTIICPVNITVECADEVPQPDVSTIISSDNCGGITLVEFVGDVLSNQICINNFSVSRTYRVTDDCGNSTECIQLITVFDNVAPLIVCPSDTNVACAEDVPPVDLSLIDASDNCGAAIVTHLGDIISNQLCPNSFTLIRTFQAIDDCGNLASCQQVITVNDNIPPEIILINPLLDIEGDTAFVQCYGQDPLWDLPQFDESSVSVIDNCGGNVNITFDQVLVSEGDCKVDGFINLYSLVWTAVDECGNTNSVSVFLALVDTIAPVIFGVPGDTTVNCMDIPELPLVIFATDECLCACIILFEESELVEGCQDGQVLLRTWTANDRCGNQTSITQRITLRDDQGPELQILQPDLSEITGDTTLSFTCNDGGIPMFFDSLNAASVISLASCGSSSVSFNREVIRTANCEFFGYAEQQTFTWIALDECGNESSLIVTVQLIDDQAPVFIDLRDVVCIGDPTLNNVEAIDNCGDAAIRFWDVSIPNPCGLGTAVRRTYEAFDECGNITRDTTILIPDEQIQPTMQLMHPLMSSMSPQNFLTINCASNGSRYTNFTADDVAFLGMCGLGLDVSFSEKLISLGDCNVDGIVATVELKWTAVDLCGNESELLILADIIDESGPVFNNFNPVVTMGCGDALPEIFISDNCGDAIVTIIDSIISGDCEFEYTVLRDITATDPCGNTTKKLQTVHVGDRSGPVFIGVDEKICDDLTLPPVTAFDECAQQFVEVLMHQDTLDILCHDGLVVERIWTAVNSCGDTAVVHQTIILNDHDAPEIMIPTHSVIRLFADNLHNRVYLSQKEIIQRLNELNENSVFAEDECDLEIDPVFNVAVSYSDDCELDGYFERRTYTWFIKDACGNVDSLSFTVDIMDNIPPVFITMPDDTIFICVPMPSVPLVYVQDSSGVDTVVFSEIILESDIAGRFIVTRKWIATDNCGNSSEYTQVIIWQPNTFLECEIMVPLLVECNSHGVVIGSTTVGGNGAINYHWEIVGEKCFIQSGQGTPEISIYTGWSQVKIILTVTDAFGCISMCMISLDCVGGGVANIEMQPVLNLPDAGQLSSSIENSTELRSLKLLQVWPNPAQNVLYLDFESAIVQPVDITILSFLGQVIQKETFTAWKGNGQREVNIGLIPVGNYLVQTQTQEGILTTMLSIMRGN